MARRIGVLVLLIVLGVALGASAAQGTGKISGTARDAQGQALPNAKLQLRNVDTGQIVATGRSKPDGGYEFAGLAPGNYVVEIVDDSGRVLGLSVATALAAGGAATGLIVALSSAGAIAGAAAAGGVGAFFASAWGIGLLAAAGAGTVWAIVAANDDASPSR